MYASIGSRPADLVGSVIEEIAVPKISRNVLRNCARMMLAPSDSSCYQPATHSDFICGLRLGLHLSRCHQTMYGSIQVALCLSVSKYFILPIANSFGTRSRAGKLRGAKVYLD